MMRGRFDRSAVRRGVVLPVVLVLVSLLALVLGSYLFYVQAETSGANAYSDMQQARLTAESGFEDVTALLRVERHNVKAWYDVPERWRHGLVWSSAYDRQSDPARRSGSRKDLLEEGASPAWRYSIVAANLDGPEGTMRYGLTPESARLNLNTASDDQIRRLLGPLLADLGVENGADLIAALLDWRDADDDVRDGGAENEYYNTLTPAYKCKNGRFDTVEELLLVKGWSAVLLWGEDFNRNGILDRNEDDADLSEPRYDNADGVLNHGVAPFLTVHSREPDTALDNKPRINLNAGAEVIAAQIAAQITEGELTPATIAYIQQLKQRNFNFAQLRSPADLVPGGETESASGGDVPGESAGGNPSGGGGDEDEDEQESAAPGRRGGPFAQDTPGADQPAPARPGRRGGFGVDPNRQPQGQDPPQPPGQGGRRGGRGGRGDQQQRPPTVAEAIAGSPATVEELPCLMNRFTVRPLQQGGGGGGPAAALIPGLVNINAAPLRVLQSIPNMPGEAAAAIVARRATLDAETLATPAWPVLAGAMEIGAFKAIAPYITTKAYQHTVEIVGYADHLKLAHRREWVIEQIGGIIQVKYTRDLTRLGLAWPIDDDTVIATTR